MTNNFHGASSRACALTIAGLDPSGGAGIAADLRCFDAAQAWGCAVCAVITVQSTSGLVDATPVDPTLILAQAREVLRHQNVRCIKTGALGSVDNVLAVQEILREHPRLPAVVDPVMIATRSPTGARLLDSRALSAMRETLRWASVVTPNIDEAEALLDRKIGGPNDLAQAARDLVRAGARAALVKGGHLPEGPVIDVLAIGNRTVKFVSPRIQTRPFHGSGCSLAALIAGHLACASSNHDEAIVDAVRRARSRLRKSIRCAACIGDGLWVLPTQDLRISPIHS